MQTVLVLFDIRNAAQKRVAILDHVQFLEHAPEGAAKVAYLNMADRPKFDPRWLDFDVIVLHTTLLCWRWHPQFAQLAGQLEWMANYKGLVAAMPQDEYDHAHTLDDWLSMLNVQIIVSCFGEGPRALLYPRMHTRAYFIEGLTGYVHPDRVAVARRSAPALSARTMDIVYRANNLPYWFGWLGNIKTRLGTDGARILGATSLRTSISVRPEDTVLGDEWFTFLGSSRAILGSESGSSVLDRRGEVATHIRTLLAEQPALTFEQADALSAGELTRHHFAALGPRHLESIMTGTVQLLVEGEFSGLFKPWEHYIPIQRDLSDLHHATEWLADHSTMQRISERAYADFIETRRNEYGVLARQFLEIVSLFRTMAAT
jgi:Glycosyl transferase family 90